MAALVGYGRCEPVPFPGPGKAIWQRLGAKGELFFKVVASAYRYDDTHWQLSVEKAGGDGTGPPSTIQSPAGGGFRFV